MSCLTDLNDRLESDPDWRDIYEKNLPDAEKVANMSPLLHVTNHPDAARVRFQDLLLQSPHSLPTSARENGYCSDKTRWAERKLNIPHCVYFYAGRAFVGFGSITLAFDERSLESAKAVGNSSPLDSGGWGLKCIKSNLPNQRIATLRDFMEKANINVDKWRADFARHLAAYFSPITAYWSDDPPYHLDPEEIYDPDRQNHWRSWVFEVRLEHPVSMLAAARWCVNADQYGDLMERARKEHKLPALAGTPLSEFLRRAIVFEEGETDSCTEMEAWVKEQAVALLA